MIYGNILEVVGKTPLVKLARLAKGYPATVCAKLEYLNPGGSVKDRIGLIMVEDAERRGLLKPGGTVIEPTSGNTGVGLALAAIMKGYSCIFTMPDKMSQEKIDTLKAFGADVIVCPTAVEPEDPRSYYSVAKRLAKELPNAFCPNQYANPANPEAHYQTTGPELWEQTEGKITHFVAGMGTGGTLSGAGKYLKEKNPKVKVVGVDPVGSVYYDFFHTKKMPGPGTFKIYKLEGIGEDFFPSTMNLDILDDVVQVNDKDGFATTRALARREGIFAGGSSGAAVWGALKIAKDLPASAVVVVLLPDTGFKYLSKPYSDAWMKENRFLEAKIDLSARKVLEGKPAAAAAVIYVEPEALVFEAIALMKQHEISQLPVFAGDECIGSIKEDQLIQLFVKHADLKKVRLKEVMGPPFPAVQPEVGIEELSGLLTRENPAVLTRLDGKWQIITKADLIHTMTR